MTQPLVPTTAGRGRPRSERAQRSILEAATQLLEEKGLVALPSSPFQTRGPFVGTSSQRSARGSGP